MEWRTNDALPDGWMVSERGDVTKADGTYVNQRLSDKGYKIISSPSGSCRGKRHYIHRLVATSFVPGIGGCNCVNHIDGNKLNNHYSNLEWTTFAGNTKHAWDNGLMRSRRSLNPHRYVRLEKYKGIDGRTTKRRVSIETAREIRRFYFSGEKDLRTLCSEHNIRKSSMWNLITGKTYKD